jgi:predicted Zn-dependent protease
VKLELWKELEAEAPPDSTWTYAWGAWHYAQGMRKARTGDLKGARAELANLRQVEADSTLKDMLIWGINSGLAVLKIGSNVLEGEILAAEGDLDGAAGKLTTAVALEDALQYQEPPDWSFPSRHELGNVLLRAKKAEQAEAVFQADLINWPESGYALEGLHRAMVAQGKTREAAPLEARIRNAWRHAEHGSSVMF